jgi:Ca2+-binding EF-hand superfamily protein
MFTGSGLFGFFHTGFIVHYRHITQKIFEQFDQDDSGGVDTYELGKLFAALG